MHTMVTKGSDTGVSVTGVQNSGPPLICKAEVIISCPESGCEDKIRSPETQHSVSISYCY